MFKLKLKITSRSNIKNLDMKTYTMEVLRTLKGDDYILTDEDRKEIARQAAEMVGKEIPEGVATEQYVKDYAQPKGEYITEAQLEKAVEDAVKDLDVDVDTSNLATKEELGKVEEKIPDQLADLQSDATHRTVTDSEKENWNKKSDFSGKYEDLTGKPTNLSAFNNDAGYMKSSEQQTVIDIALAQAKASGEFDGEDGKDGKGFAIASVTANTLSADKSATVYMHEVPAEDDGTVIAYEIAFGIPRGEKGDKGDAYTLTSTDKQTIVNAVIQALPVYAGEVV